MARDLHITTTLPENATRKSVAARAASAVAPLDGQAIRRRRIECGMSETVLAQTLGVSAQVIDGIEHGGEQSALTLQFVTELTRTLGCRLIDIVTTDVHQPTAPNAGDTIDDTDPAVVGRHLAATARVHVDDLAAALDWTTGRTRWALHTLEARLEDVGMAISWLADSEVQLVSAVGDTTTVDAVSRRSLVAYGLFENEAAFLHHMIHHGPASNYRSMSPTVIARLRAAGLVVTDTIYGPRNSDKGSRNSEAPRLTNEARFNLYLPATTDTDEDDA